MRKTLASALIPAACLIAPPASAQNSLADAIKNGEASLGFRLRYEDVQVDDLAAGVEDSNEALTLRTRLNYKTAAYRGFTGFLEMDDVTPAEQDYNDTLNGEAGPAIADPKGTEVNQAWLNYNQWDSDFKFGRQRITLDNHRFIGSVAWRQNEQTYDAFSVTAQPMADTTLFYGYIRNVNRIFGENSAVGDARMKTHLFNGAYDGLPLGKLTAYVYLLESDDKFAGFADWSTDTYGLRFKGKTEGDVSLHYELEYATQSEGDDNPKDYDADYYKIELGAGFSGITVSLGQESLGADGTDGFFVTPLATLHKFQGWTDMFLNKGKGNIAEGIVDTYLSAGTNVAGVKLLLVYHDFVSDEDNAAGDDDLGDEIGLVVSKKFGSYGLQLKYADYSVGDETAFNAGGLTLRDTQKLWLTATAQF